MKVTRYWVKEDHLVHEAASLDVSSQPGTVCVVKVDEVVQMLASLGNSGWKKQVGDPLPQQWEPPMSPCDPVPQPYELPKGPCDPPPEPPIDPLKVTA